MKILPLPFFYALALLLFFELPVRSQPLPKMFVHKLQGQHREAWFTKRDNNRPSKLDILKKFNPNQQLSYHYDIRSFTAFITTLITAGSASGANAILIYPSAYDPRHPAPATAASYPFSFKDNELVILFAPAKLDNPTFPSYAKPIGKFHYIITEGRATPIKVDTPISNTWRTNYNNNICGGSNGWNSELEQQAVENQYMGFVSDTRSIFYSIADLKEMYVTEVATQLSQFHVTVSGINMNLVSYPDTGISQTANLPYANRFLLQFDFTRKKAGSTTEDEVFYLDDETGFPNRHTLRVNKEKVKFEKYKPQKLFHEQFTALFAFDNGQLCPLNCPGDGTKAIKPVIILPKAKRATP